MRNWAGNYEYKAATIERPESLDALVAIVRAADRVHAVGSRHAFNDMADAPGGTLVSLEKVNRIVSLDTAGPTPSVTIEGGMTYGQLGPVLHAEGFALHNLASLPHITVAGAVATATHGSGVSNGSLSTAVSAIELVTASDEVKTLRRGEADFNGAVVGLGALGIVSKLTLDLVPTFDVEQHVYQQIPMTALADAYEAILASAYSVSVFTTWQTDSFEQLWMKCRAGQPHFDVRSIGGTPATHTVHPIENVPGMPPFTGIDPEKCTIQLGQPGPWFDRLPHFKLEHTPSSGEELQTEFFVPRQHAKAAWAAIASLRDEIRPLIQVSELRVVAADELWMSPYYQRPSVGIHFTWRREPAAVLALAKRIEQALTPFDTRPHWAKVFGTSQERLAELYPRMIDFRAMQRRYDPAGKFRTPYVERTVG